MAGSAPQKQPTPNLVDDKQRLREHLGVASYTTHRFYISHHTLTKIGLGGKKRELTDRDKKVIALSVIMMFGAAYAIYTNLDVLLSLFK